MSKHDSEKNFHKLLKKLKTPHDCPAMKWKLHEQFHGDNGDGDFDKEIIPLLTQLNNKRWHTVASCAGHTLRDIKEHKMAYQIEEPYRMIVFIHASIKDIGTFMTMIEEMKYVTNGYFICELGSNQDDYSNITEVGFIPFQITVYCVTKRKRDSDILKLQKIAKKYNN